MLPLRPAATEGDLQADLAYGSTLEAISRGTADGVRLVVNVGAMLIVLVSLVALVNGVLGTLPLPVPLTLERMLGWLFAPVAFLMGVPWVECGTAGSLLGTKLVLNELIAYVQMSQLPVEALSPRSDLVMTYALCGFANLGSLGILIGGLQTMAPGRTHDILSLGPRALFSGTLVTCISGAMVGLLF
jgi:CNT family concentrative nucleoside transporter